MLIQFRVENYLSFNEVQSLSLIKGQSRNLKEHIHEVGDKGILRTAAIFGANASGKTNLIEAISNSHDFITQGIPISPNEYCRVSKSNRKKPTSFEYEIEIEGETFVYGFETILSESKIKREWLYRLDKAEKKVLFERTDIIITDLEKNGEDGTRFTIYAEDALSVPQRLFLTEIGRRNFGEGSEFGIFKKILTWLITNIRIIPAGVPTEFAFSQEQTELSSKVLSACGTGVTEVRTELLEGGASLFPQSYVERLLDRFRKKNKKNPSPGEVIATIRMENQEPLRIELDESGNPVVKRLVFRHGEESFLYNEESEGTNRLMDLLPILSKDSGNEAIYIIDELDRSMHPQLTQKFVRDFEKLCEKSKRQLIFTTHESRLMDLELLRRDEIWFAEKNEDGSTALYSLEEFNERGDRRVDKAYLEGRYGATPCFKSLFPPLE
ncbi:MAG: ATP/GTP-binding protein [Methanomassiliicoccaceae archaeon]|nr:ATP/GTP-binding protein [Methanomassiliicoccaceae archaeon]